MKAKRIFLVSFIVVSFVMVIGTGVLSAAQKDKPESAPKQINVTGYWEAQNAGFYAKLRQTGDRVIGETKVFDPGAIKHPIRGGWSQGYLALIIFNTDQYTPGCVRDSFIGASKGTAMRIEGKWMSGADEGREDAITRNSAEAAGDVEYPYEKEPTLCGDLLAYELTFDLNSNVLKGSEWPILAAVAKLLNSDKSLKIRVVGHTDSTGSSDANRTLSMKRAEEVKKKLVEKYGADDKRILTEGMGQDQPLQDNSTPLGRAANRRVEISIAQ